MPAVAIKLVILLLLFGNAEAAASSWALQPLTRPNVPQPDQNDAFQNWFAHPIDRFVLSRMQEKGLNPSIAAENRVLVRRIYLDVTGLLPSPEQIAIDPSDEREWTQLIDSLLASPRYGEKWARHWLDVVRFAESNGFEMNQPRPTAWRYRDYVIQSFNENKPYDRFILEQLIGDLLGVDEATGFLVAGPFDQVKSPDPVLTANQRADELHDIVSVTGAALLGLTVGCARCHDHKFDPISQVDYFRMKAVFEGVQHGERDLKDDAAESRAKELSKVKSDLKQINEELMALEPLAETTENPAHPRASVNPQFNVERIEPVKARFLRFTINKTTGAEPCIDELEVYSTAGKNVALATAGAKALASGTYPNSDIHKLEHIHDGKHGNGRSWISNENGQGWVQLEFSSEEEIDRVLWGRDKEQKFSDRLAIDYAIETSQDGVTWTLAASSVDRAAYAGAKSFVSSAHHGNSSVVRDLQEKQKALSSKIETLRSAPKVYAGTFTSTPEPTHRLHRGDPMLKREVIEPGTLSAIHVSASPVPKSDLTPDQLRRRQFAQWVVSSENPLPARVMVNRIWQHHFGRGLVATPSDFGENGARPTHPELLDWLAMEFISSGWNIKHLHRLILTSQTFRQSSAARPDGMKTDAGTQWLWRFPPRRLEAEAIRDSILQVSGKLDLRMGGPGFSFFEANDNYVRVYAPRNEWGNESFRRMVYGTVIRQRVDGVFGVFDCPDAGQTAPARTQSTTPLQALNMMNSTFILQQAKAFSERVEREAGAKSKTPVDVAFRLAFQRDPSADELAAAEQFIQEEGLALFCRALLNSNEFVYVF